MLSGEIALKNNIIIINICHTLNFKEYQLHANNFDLFSHIFYVVLFVKKNYFAFANTIVKIKLMVIYRCCTFEIVYEKIKILIPQISIMQVNAFYAFAAQKEKVCLHAYMIAYSNDSNNKTINNYNNKG